MNTRSVSSKTNGTALVLTMLLLTIGMIFVGLYLSRISQELRLSRNQIDYQESCLLASRGLDYGILKLKSIVMQYQLSPNPPWTTNYLQTQLDAIPAPTNWNGFVYQTPDGRTAFHVRMTSPINVGTITNGSACLGSSGSFQYFTVACGCGRPGGKSAVIQQTLQVVGVQLIRFGVFYDPDLEIFPGAEMDFYGPVHVNGNLYIGGAGVPLNFYDRVTAHGNVWAHRKDTNTYWSSSVVNTNGTLVSNLQGGQYIDSDYNDWMTKAIQLWGGNLQSAAHGVPDLAPPIGQQDSTNNHVIIERPNTTNAVATGIDVSVSTNQYNQQTENEKFANKAALTLFVASNGQVKAYDYFTNNISTSFSNVVLKTNAPYGGKSMYAKTASGSYMYATNNPPKAVYDVTQTNFYDARQQSFMAPVDIYVDQLLSNYPALYSTNTDQGAGVVYVTRDPPTGAMAGAQPCVRIRNGSSLTNTTLGLTFASDLPMYVEGNFNTNQVHGTTNDMPALLAGDAVTMLSTSWNDAYSKSNSIRIPASTIYNTVIMTGCGNTSSNNYNGGLENDLRFLEDWSGKTVTFRGSIIDLWHPKNATNQWYYGTGPEGMFRYNAPTRNWGYDNIYRTQAPPGMTRVYGMEELQWARTTWNATTSFW